MIVFMKQMCDDDPLAELQVYLHAMQIDKD